MLSGADDAELIDAAFEAGASAYILKTTDPDCVTTAIQQAFEPSIYLARPRETRSATATATRVVPQLTRRELEILRLVSEGRSNRQVGQVLWVTDQTVKFHLANIYRKLGVGSRYDAARWAQEHGVLDVASRQRPARPRSSRSVRARPTATAMGTATGTATRQRARRQRPLRPADAAPAPPDGAEARP